MTDFKINDAGTWKKPLQIHVKDAGSWSAISKLHIKNAGTWIQVWQYGFVFTSTIASSVQNYSLQAAATSAGWNGTDPLIANVTINSGIYVGSASTGSYAFYVTSTFPAGSSISITNNGYIIGCGGAGGTGHRYTNSFGTVGAAGGHALGVSCPITFNNTNGQIIGGGGGGGGGGGTSTNARPSDDGKGSPCGTNISLVGDGGGGGGGRGWNSGAGGYSYGYMSPTSASPQSGSAGGTSTAGAGGTGGYHTNTCNTVYGAGGGAGGGGGSAGATGATGTWGGTSGGAGGYSVAGNSNITWNGTGTRLGSIV